MDPKKVEPTEEHILKFAPTKKNISFLAEYFDKSVDAIASVYKEHYERKLSAK